MHQDCRTRQPVPCIQIRTWMEYLLCKKPEYLLGGFHPGQEAKMLLETYWQNISVCMPDHDGMLACKDKWCSSIPFYLHLDEGVGQRKRAVLVINFPGGFRARDCKAIQGAVPVQ